MVFQESGTSLGPGSHDAYCKTEDMLSILLCLYFVLLNENLLLIKVFALNIRVAE